MLEALSGKRPKGKYLGPTALMEHGWRVKTSPMHQMRYDINNVHLLMRYTFTGQVKYQNTRSWLLDKHQQLASTLYNTFHRAMVMIASSKKGRVIVLCWTSLMGASTSILGF